MSGQTINQSATRIEALELQSSAYGVTLPLAYGRTRLPGNLLWYGGFKATPHTSTQSSGKGGGVKVQNTTYTYSASVMMGLCEGPVLEVPSIWRGKNLYTGGYAPTQILSAQETVTVIEAQPYTVVHADRLLSRISCRLADVEVSVGIDGARNRLEEGFDFSSEGGTVQFGAHLVGRSVRVSYQYATGGQPQTAMQQLGLTLLAGQVGQPVWSHLATNVPEQAIPYSGIAAVAGQDYDLGSGAQVENHMFELLAPLAYSVAAGVPDADPADFTPEVLCNARFGAMFPAERLASLDAWSDYCRAAGLLMSPALTEQMTAASFVDVVCKLTNAWPVWSDGQLKIRPLGDTPLAANGRSYTPDTTPVYDLGDDDFLVDGPDGERVEIRRRGQADVHNHVRLEFRNRANQYNLEIAEAKDQAHIDTFGLRTAAVVQAHWICDAGTAQRAVQLMLQRSVAVRNEYRFTLPWTKALLERGDLVTLTESVQGLERLPVRITQVTEGADGELAMEAEDFPLGVATAALYSGPSGLGYAADYNVAPGSIDPPVIFEAPADLTATGIEVYAAVRGSNSDWGGCQVWVSLDGTRYRQTGVIYGGARYGRLSAPMTSTAGVRDLGRAQLLNASPTDAQALQTLCWVGPGAQEYFAYETAQLVAAGTYTLGGLVRGAYGTTQGAHQDGDLFVRVDERIARSGPIEAGLVGETIHFKFPSFNIYGGALQDLGEVEPVAYTITGAMAALRPGIAGKAVKLRASALTFQYPKAGGVNPSVITLTAEPKGTLSGAVTWQVVAGTADLQGSGDVRTIAAASMVSESVTVLASITDAVGVYSDEVTIVKVHDGLDGAPALPDVPDLTPPPTPSGVEITAGLSFLFIETDPPQFSQGHGYRRTQVYGAKYTGGSLPTYSSAEKVHEFVGNVGSFPSALGTQWHLWLTWVSSDGVESSVPAGGTNGYQATTGKIGTTDLGDLVVTAGKLADGSITAGKLASQVIDATKFAAGVEPVSLVSAVPGTRVTATVFNTTDGKLYRWDGNAYGASVAAADLTGQIGPAQLQAGSVDASKLAAQAVDLTKLASGLRAVEIVATLPTSGNVEGRTVYLTTDDKLYRYSGTQWLASVAATDVTGQIATGQIADAALTVTKFAAGLRPVEIVTALPSSGNFEGRTVYLTTDDKLYRHDGSTWLSSVPATDITGALVATQIADGAVTAIKTTIAAINAATGGLNANTVDAAQLVTNAVSALKIAAGAVTAVKTAIAAIDPSTGNLTANSVTATQIAAGAVTAAKIAADTITANEIAANAIGVNELAAGAVTTGKLAAGAVTTAALAAGAVTANEIAAGTITGAKIAAGAIGTNELAANSITAGKIQSGAVTATQVAANAISTDKLLVTGKAAELNADPNCMDASAWVPSISGGATGAIVVDATARAGTTAWQGSNATGGSFEIYSGATQIDASKNYRIEIDARSVSGAATCYLLVRFEDATGTSLAGSVYPTGWPSAGSFHYFGLTNQVPPAAYTTYGISFGPQETAKIPPGAKQVRVGALLAYVGSGVNRMSNVRLFQKAYADLIVDGAITTQKLAAGAVTANEIAANSITAAKIQAGAVTATQVAANAITTDKLLVTGRGRALNDDPGCSDITAWNVGPGAVSVTTGAGAPVGTTVLRGTNGTNILSRSFPVEAGKTYKVSLWARQVSGGGVMYIRLYANNAANSLISYVVTGISQAGNFEGLSVPGGWTRYSGFIVPAAGSVYAQVSVHMNWNTTGVTDVTDVRCEEYLGADLIVDGSITASKINSNGLDIRDLAGNVVFASGQYGPAYLPFVASAGVTLVGDTATCTGTAGTWNAQVYSKDGYTGGASASGVMAAGAFAMFGLNTDPTANASYDTIDFAIHASGNGQLYAFENGSGLVINPTWSIGDALAVTYDGSFIRYLQNGQVRRTVAVAANLTFYFDSSWLNAGDSVSNLRFGPYGNPSSVQPSNPITGGNVSTYIAAAAIQNAQIASLDAGKITTGSLDANRIAANSITGGMIQAGAIGATQIAANAIAVGSAAIQNGAIVNAMLGNASITTAKIADLSVVNAKLGDASVTAAKIADANITTAKIADASITNAKVADLDAGKIVTGTLNAGRIGAGSIDASKLSVAQLSAISGTIGLLRTAASGARLELESNQIRVYDANNVLRVRMGIW